ncbi:MAG: MarR family transcriptional regulator [Sphingopyxis sp.]|uniref:MarR family transcriptional regulator n=1 Tax=unclassified Sphingopyxis TaxID=2614943 RepID=UPI001A4CA47A|nr:MULTISPECIES: helix-turn-helix domain-containing protein [unclassified Sphingopyxis]MBL9068824.1 MarR family transcriptional regulator [Sphingopyxis sp.]HEV7340532.1 helix-turn-helix domain-containing protein [Sphingopyxis sp.]
MTGVAAQSPGMGHRERVLDFVSRFAGRDDDEIAQALHITRRQTVNQICRALVQSGQLERRPNGQGKIGNYPASGEAEPITDAHSARATKLPSILPTDWFWEGNVVEKLAAHFIRDGWTIVRCADTASREPGPDIHAERSGATLLVEVKGYPSAQYRDPRRAGEKKRTSPSLQAQQWFSHALLKGMRLQNEYPNATVALAFPDFPRYRTLTEEIRGGLDRVRLTVLFVSDAGTVSIVAAPAP